MKGFTLLELILVITITALLTLVALPVIQKSLFGEKDLLKAFILKNLNSSMKKNEVIRLVGDGRTVKSSTGESVELPFEGICHIYPNGELRGCWFRRGENYEYYTVLDF